MLTSLECHPGGEPIHSLNLFWRDRRCSRKEVPMQQKTTMIALESWQFSELQRLAQTDKIKAEEILNSIWQKFPEVFQQLAISAVDHETLSVQKCSELLGLTHGEVIDKRSAHRGDATHTLIVIDEKKVARLADCGVAVWEIVREYRNSGSVDRLENAFPSLSRADLVAAMRYAQENPAEIEAQILQYENLRSKVRTEYPFTM